MGAIQDPLRQLGIPQIGRQPTKIRALFNLREALVTERYEACAELIRRAKELGARDSEVRLLLEDPRRTPGA